MAKILLRRSYVDVLGYIWWPNNIPCSVRYSMAAYDVENAKDEDGHLTRESLERWLMLHSGDFSSVTDFSASVEDGEETRDFPWSSEENEMAYLDTLGGGEAYD